MDFDILVVLSNDVVIMAGDKKYWFARKKYGYGWVPSTWQGWLALTVYFVVLVLAAAYLAHDNFDMFIYAVIVATISLLALCGLKGPSPRWQWGEEKKSKSKQK